MRAFLALAVLLAAWPGQPRAACEGRVPDFIGGICWSCMFPLRVAGVVLYGREQADRHLVNILGCSCGFPRRTGLPVAFWEPARVVEVTRTPYCLTTLGGLQLGSAAGARAPGARTGTAAEGTTSYAFYHAHWYTNPLLHWLGVLLDFECLERTGLDLAYVSELDPTWEDDELAAILEPEMLLTANLPAVAACVGDCFEATRRFPRKELWWCAGCNGPLYPANGNVAAHVSGRHSSSLLAMRLAMRMHRSGASHYTHGYAALCNAGWTSPVFQKDAYKMSMILPRTQGKRRERCCEAFGAPPELWASGSEWPVTGEDFSYLLFRKRNCCVGYDF